MNPYSAETLDNDNDDGTMPNNVAMLSDAVIGHKIVSVKKSETQRRWGGVETIFRITLDNGTEVSLRDSEDCCAYTYLESFLLHADRIDHAITGAGTTGGYTKWHIYADLGDVLELEVGWSCGNPFYYGYGFDIWVNEIS